MKKKTLCKSLINLISQKQNKQQDICIFSVHNKYEIRLLYFLWLNKIIYGYLTIGKKCTIFLKNQIKSKQIFFNKININNIKKKSVQKHEKWFKNNILIINSNNNWFNIKQLKNMNIGGYIAYKIQ